MVNDARLLLLVVGPNLALWGALFGESLLAPEAGVQAMAPVPLPASVPLPVSVPDVTPASPPSVVPLRRPRQLRVFQPPAEPPPPIRRQRQVVARLQMPAPTPVVVPAPDPVPLPVPAMATTATTAATAVAVSEESAESVSEALPGPDDLQEAVLRARALLPEPPDAPSPLP